MEKALLSVVMPVHNALPFLDESIRSILQQTWSNFEFIILDDASTDGSSHKLREWAGKDPRIKVFRSDTQLGLVGSSNMVLSRASGAIVARMDADDVSDPERLQRQWEVMESRPDVVVVGSLCVGIDENGREVRPRDRWRLLRRSPYIPFAHGSVMFRRSAFDQVGGYAAAAEGGEDQDLFSRMSKQGTVVTLSDALYRYRYHSRNATLLNGVGAVLPEKNGSEVASIYMHGAMRLWAGNPPMVLQPLLANKSLKWTPANLMILMSAVWGAVSPPSLRGFLRSSIRARDLIASIRVKDGRPYEWRSE